MPSKPKKKPVLAGDAYIYGDSLRNIGGGLTGSATLGNTRLDAGVNTAGGMDIGVTQKVKNAFTLNASLNSDGGYNVGAKLGIPIGGGAGKPAARKKVNIPKNGK